MISLARNKSTFCRFEQKQEEYILRFSFSFLFLILQVHVCEGEHSPEQTDGLQVDLQQLHRFALKTVEALEDNNTSGFLCRSAEFYRVLSSGALEGCRKCEMKYIQLCGDQTLVSAGTPDNYTVFNFLK